MNRHPHSFLSRRTRRADLLILISLGVMAVAIVVLLWNRAQELIALLIAGAVAGGAALIADRCVVRRMGDGRTGAASDLASSVDLRSQRSEGSQHSEGSEVAPASTAARVAVESSHSAHRATSPDPAVRLEVAQSSSDQALLQKLADDESAEVRAAVAERVDDLTVLQRLARDADALVKQRAEMRLSST